MAREGVLKPLRGTESNLANVVLDEGEIAFAYPESGPGTGIGGIKMGNGTDTFSNLDWYTYGNGGIGKDVIADTSESTDTAAYVHEVGNYFMNRNEKLCKTTKKINIGDTISVGTGENDNCVLVSVGEELSLLNSNYTVMPLFDYGKSKDQLISNEPYRKQCMLDVLTKYDINSFFVCSFRYYGSYFTQCMFLNGYGNNKTVIEIFVDQNNITPDGNGQTIIWQADNSNMYKKSAIAFNINRKSLPRDIPDMGTVQIYFSSGTTIGNYTFTDAMQGTATRYGDVCIGYIADSRLENVYMISSSSLTGWQYIKKITTT